MSLVPKVSQSLEVATVGTSPIQRGKPKPKVLDEDDYLEKLETIIQRDFYPDIGKLKAQTEYLEAVDRNDVEKIRQLQLRYSCRRTDKPLNTPGTPAYFETPIANKNKQDKHADDDSTEPTTSHAAQNPDAPDEEYEEPVESETSNLDQLGVDKFLTKYTSEDNASFEEIMERNEIRHREKYSWMYKAEDEHKKRMESSLALTAADEQMLAIASGSGPRAASLQNWDYQTKNAVMFVPDGVDWSQEELLRRNKMAERVIVHENTRFGENPFSDDEARQTMSKAAVIQSAVSKGKVDAQGDDVSFKHPMQRFSFVATPSPAPGVNESPIMTWGEIEGTPFRLDAGDMPIQRTPGPTFKMPEVPLRDKLAHELTDEISKRNREKKQTAIKQVSLGLTPKFGNAKSSERLASLSPAALRLATTKLGIRVGTDKALKASYSPSPARSVAGEKTPLASTSVHKKPADSWAEVVDPSTSADKPDEGDSNKRSTDESLTDNLLHLKSKRPRASDFF